VSRAPEPEEVETAVGGWGAEDLFSGAAAAGQLPAMPTGGMGEHDMNGWGGKESMPPVEQQQQQQPSPPPQRPQQPTEYVESTAGVHTQPSVQGTMAMNTHHMPQSRFPPMGAIQELWGKRSLCDIRLIGQNPNPSNPNRTCISVHSAVIAAASTEIEKILVKSVQENGSLPPDLIIHVEPTALEEVVRFMYTGELRIHESTVKDIMHATETLGLGEAMELCVEFLSRSITSANALHVSDLATTFNRPELEQRIQSFLVLNISTLVHEQDFLEQPVERVKNLLASDEASFVSEVDVFQAVVRWTRHDLMHRAPQFAELLAETVRLPQMTPEQLMDDVEVEELVRADRAATQLVTDCYRYNSLPESRRATLDIPGKEPRRPTQLQYSHFGR